MVTAVDEETVQHEPEMPSFFDNNDKDDDGNDQENEAAKG